MKSYYFKIIISIFCFSLCSPTQSFGQRKLTKKTKEIVTEGKLLYKSEISSWYGTDIFRERYEEKENIRGYFSYTEEDLSKCIFFSEKDSKTIVVGTVTFESNYSIEAGKLDLQERNFTDNEKSLYEIRKIALEQLKTDTIFKRYENTNFNIVPIIYKGKKKVYILTGPTVNDVVIFGNDYLITLNKKNEITSTKALHQNIIPIYNHEGDSETTIHSHTEKTGHFITPTDICTLMLYSKLAGWKTHHVVSEKYLNQWNCETNELNVIPMKTIKKIQKSTEKKKNN